MRQEEFAGKSIEELAEMKRDILMRRGNAQGDVDAMSSRAGTLIRERKKVDLEARRRMYLKIPVSGKPAEELLRDFMLCQAYEKHLMSDLALMKTPEKFVEGLDADLRFCNDAIAGRERDSRTSRKQEGSDA